MIWMSFLLTTSNPEKAYQFYYKHIYEDNKDLVTLCSDYNFESKQPSWKWELFSAILMGDKAKDNNKGADLINYEVKSAKENGAYEYQYHCDSWPTKISEDKRVSHLYISYSENCEDIVVRLMSVDKILHYFQEWETHLPAYWTTEEIEKVSNKRFRRAIPASMVSKNGKIIFVVKNTQLLYSNNLGMDSNLLLKPVKTKSGLSI